MRRASTSRRTKIDPYGTLEYGRPGEIAKPHRWAWSAVFYPGSREIAFALGEALGWDDEDDEYLTRCGDMRRPGLKAGVDLAGQHVFFDPTGPACAECGTKWSDSADERCAPMAIKVIEPDPSPVDRT